MNRREFLLGAAALSAPAFAFDGQTATIAGRDYALTDILAPSLKSLSGWVEPGADFAAAAFQQIVRRGAPMQSAKETVDRWGRIEGTISWRTNDGRETTLQELLVAEGAARVAPESKDYELIERCYAAENAARGGKLGLWAHSAWRIRDAARAERGFGYQVYRGVIAKASERDGRVYFNFGDDFRTDFTATAARRDFRRWREKPAAEFFQGKEVEARGLVLWINGPSIELKHEMQLRVL